MKVLRASVWKTRDINIGGQSPTDINFASIGNQVQFIDTIKYFQQSLGGSAGSLTSSEKVAIRRQCHVFLISRPKSQRTFVSLSEKDQKRVLDYLSTGKGVIPYQLITDLDSLNILPRQEFFLRASILFCFKRFSNINRRLRICKKILRVNEIEKLRRTQ